MNLESSPGSAFRHPANSSIREPWRTLLKPSIGQPLAIFFVLAVLLTGLKLERIDQQFGDTAMYYQVAENIAAGKGPVSNVFAANDAYGMRSMIAKTPAELATDPLSPSDQAEMNHLAFHANYIFFPIGWLSALIPPPIILMTLYGLSFAGLLAAAFFGLRAMGIPILASSLFCLLVMTHPAWVDGLEWQFYPERLFLVAGFALLYLATRPEARRVGMICAALLCALISERAAMIGGLCLLAYVALYWRSVSDRTFRGAVGVVLLVYGFLILKFGVSNPEYGSYLPTNWAGIVHMFSNAQNVSNLAVFLIVNAFLLILSAFEWRALLIAIVAMLPNIVGSRGGAEKIGWSTHYHDLYFPVLVWAAVLGYARLWTLARSRGGTAWLVAGTAVWILLLGSLNPAGPPGRIFDPAHLAQQFFPRFVGEADTYFGGRGRLLAERVARIRAFVPPGATVTAPESAFVALYSHRNIQFYPLDLDRADYAVVTLEPTPGVYGGTFSVLSADQREQIDREMTARMHRDGYDFAHALVLPDAGLAVVKRAKGA